MELAAPLLAGFSRYLANLPESPIAMDMKRQLLWVWEGEDGEPWRTGDMMTHELPSASLCRVSRCPLRRPQTLGRSACLPRLGSRRKSGPKDRAPPGGSGRSIREYKPNLEMHFL